ncbi:MAG: ABC transporter substrate-binding protein [Candidatus Hydrogenedentes bacterium]|nr:ABC transporter substrate-binding protein [Candidatus Hydrogenedentota bacterium]
MKTYLFWALGAIACAVALVVLWPQEAQTPEERKALGDRRTIITYWDRHTGHEAEARKALIDEFNALPGNKVYVRTVIIGSRVEKLLTAIAGGAPPDVCSLGSSVLAQLAAQGCFMPIEDEVAKSSYLSQSNFLPHAWSLVSFDGHIWAIPTTTDTYCLLWNKNAFRRAGLDPEVPPKTIKEIEEFAVKLTVKKGGQIEQYGFVPWQPWIQTYMWGGLFGGKWFDEKTMLASCANDPEIIKAFQWVQSFAINPKKSEQLPFAVDPGLTAQNKLGGQYQSANNPFYSGKVAMITEGEWQCTFIPKYAPDLDWGVAPIPQPEGVPPLCFAPECVVDAVPAGSRHPREAWEFLHWFYSPRPGGTSPASDYNFAIHNVPPRRDEAMQDRFISDPKFKVFINELLSKPGIILPPSPAAQYLLDKVENYHEKMTFGWLPAEQAAQEIEDLANTEIRAAWKLSGRKQP